ncbi:MAG: cupin domain-containing protein [Gammaproteobacteria bacterium]|nr:MAG: cupin domain-containing protein [Gammaproteobacteria bacterium]
MLKKDFLKILDEILSRKYLKEEEKNRLEAIKESEKQLPEEIFTDQLITKLDLITIKGVTDEDGYFKEFINTIDDNGQESQTEIFYLLKEKQVSCLHKLNTTETWRWLEGEDLSLYVFIKDKMSEIVLNAANPFYTIPKNTLFGAKLKSNTNENFVLVTCKCVPGFILEHYQNPTSEDLKKFLSVPSYEQVIKELTPTKKSDGIFIQPFIQFIQFFKCCIGVKQMNQSENQALLIDPSQNR